MPSPPQLRVFQTALSPTKAASIVSGWCNRESMKTLLRNDDGLRAPAVLLWDVDNMPGPRGAAWSLATVLNASVADDALRIAGARRVTYRRMRRGLEEIGFEVLSGGNGASGADRCLCERGRALHRHGHQTFVVISNDGYFARLARLGAVHVVTMDPRHLSVRLDMAAASVTELRYGETGWHYRRGRSLSTSSRRVTGGDRVLPSGDHECRQTLLAASSCDDR